jgi:hypothetical protein
MKSVVLSLITILILVGTAFTAMASKPEVVHVQIKKEGRASKSNLTIKFMELIEDSRCPTDVNCVWAGRARIKVSIKRSTGAPKIFEMDTMRDGAVLFGRYKITLTDITPHPASNIRINRNGYVATFSVAK